MTSGRFANTNDLHGFRARLFTHNGSKDFREGLYIGNWEKSGKGYRGDTFFLNKMHSLFPEIGYTADNKGLGKNETWEKNLKKRGATGPRGPRTGRSNHFVGEIVLWRGFNRRFVFGGFTLPAAEAGRGCGPRASGAEERRPSNPILGGWGGKMSDLAVNRRVSRH